MPISALIVRVPSAEAMVGDLRERFDATALLGVPAHITVLVPFMDPADLTAAVCARIQQALDAVPSFSFSLGRVGRFPTTAYLAPEPAQPFIEMTSSLVRAFPGFPPYGGEHASTLPHLTAAHGDAEAAHAATAELEQRLRRAGPIEAQCSSVALIQNSTGRWREAWVFHLPSAAT